MISSAASSGLLEDDRWDQTLVAASGTETSLRDAAELVRRAADADIPIELPGGVLPPGENDSYPVGAAQPRLGFPVRPLSETVPHYVDWLTNHPAAQGRTRA